MMIGHHHFILEGYQRKNTQYELPDTKELFRGVRKGGYLMLVVLYFLSLREYGKIIDNIKLDVHFITHVARASAGI